MVLVFHVLIFLFGYYLLNFVYHLGDKINNLINSCAGRGIGADYSDIPVLNYEEGNRVDFNTGTCAAAEGVSLIILLVFGLKV
jgi:hypothetical protein